MKSVLKKLVVVVLQWQAKLVLKKYNPKIVAVTGSVGKTSTKDAIFVVLSAGRYVRKSEKSFNSDIGVPLTILGCHNAWSNPFAWLSNFFHGLALILSRQSYPDWLVLEIGADSLDPTYMSRLTKWLKPDVSVFTTFAKVPVHIEFFGSVEKLFEEKISIFDALKREGVGIFNFDDEDVHNFGEQFEGNKIFYGFKDGVIKASDYQIISEKTGKGELPVGVGFSVDIAGTRIEAKVFGSLGKQNVYSALAALAVGHSQGMLPADMAISISTYAPPRGRMRLIDGVKGSLVIDDTYNSSPVASVQALETLKNLKNVSRKIAVLGDMMELGYRSSEAHKEVGELAVFACDVLVTVGVRSRKIAETALEASFDEKKVYQFDDSKEAGLFLQNFVAEGDVVLVKGSQSMRMERAVKEIMAIPERASELLVRQEEEWANR